MIEVVLAAFNILLLMLIWECFLKKTLLDTHRDRLFDLRCELREKFAQKKALDTEAYKQTRELINAQIALTENLSILQYVLWSEAIKEKDEIKLYIEKKNHYRFAIDDEELSKVIEQTRIKASHICIDYMIFSSLWMTVTILVLGFIVAACLIVKNLVSNCRKMFSQAFRKDVFHQIITTTTSKLNLSQDVVEDASMFLIKNA